MISSDYPENSLIYRLLKRAEIRRQIPSRKSVQEGQPDRISDLLEEAAVELDLQKRLSASKSAAKSDYINYLQSRLDEYDIFYQTEVKDQ